METPWSFPTGTKAFAELYPKKEDENKKWVEVIIKKGDSATAAGETLKESDEFLVVEIDQESGPAQERKVDRNLLWVVDMDAAPVARQLTSAGRNAGPTAGGGAATDNGLLLLLILLRWYELLRFIVIFFIFFKHILNGFRDSFICIRIFFNLQCFCCSS